MVTVIEDLNDNFVVTEPERPNSGYLKFLKHPAVFVRMRGSGLTVSTQSWKECRG